VTATISAFEIFVPVLLGGLTVAVVRGAQRGTPWGPYMRARPFWEAFWSQALIALVVASVWALVWWVAT
jgi:hypothetical protein